ncbi:MAG: GTP cyclohydrolase II [Alphaproteobacteria bacterium]
MTILPTAINGDHRELMLDRARLELSQGRAILVRSDSGARLVVALESVLPATYEAVRDIADRQGLGVVLSRRRAAALQLIDTADVENGSLGVAAGFARDTTLDALRRHLIIGETENSPLFKLTASDESDVSSEDVLLTLAMESQLLPVLVSAGVSDAAISSVDAAVSAGDIVTIGLDPGLGAWFSARTEDCEVVPVARADVPLIEGVYSRFTLFRGGRPLDEHIAVQIGQIDHTKPVPVRMHSSCLTGDLFGSLRCDCGPQLIAAIETIAERGSGIILYLSQEGRGIGLANKLRAYELQDRGLDTYEANDHLGFGADQRRFDIAAAMLKSMEIDNILLLTNNPGKIDALEREGVTVSGRLPLTGGLNRFNSRYLRAKIEKGGHFSEAGERAKIDPGF